MNRSNLSAVPSSELERTINFNLRHKTGKRPYDYLDQFLEVSRQYGYATQDGTWGELEKELEIAFRNIERYRRFFQKAVDDYLQLHGGDEDDVVDQLLALGELHWQNGQPR